MSDMKISVDSFRVKLNYEQFNRLEYVVKHAEYVRWYKKGGTYFDEDAGICVNDESLENMWADNFLSAGIQEIRKWLFINVDTSIFPVFCRDFIIALIYGVGLAQDEIIKNEGGEKVLNRNNIKELVEIFEATKTR